MNKIVCLCGSSKCKKAYKREELFYRVVQKDIVLSIEGSFTHADNIPMPDGVKERLDKLHLEKIAVSDKVIIISENNYIGESTLIEIMEAFKLHKNVVFTEDTKNGNRKLYDLFYRIQKEKGKKDLN